MMGDECPCADCQPWYVCDWFKGFNEDVPSYKSILSLIRELDAVEYKQRIPLMDWIAGNIENEILGQAGRRLTMEDRYRKTLTLEDMHR